MKKIVTLCVVGAMALAPAAAVAGTGSSASTKVPTTTKGKTVSFKSKVLTVKTKHGNVKFTIGKKTGCGSNTGQMGGDMPCSNLKKKKYMKKVVQVSWTKGSKGKKNVVFVNVTLK
jgi:hypothetical protein